MDVTKYPTKDELYDYYITQNHTYAECRAYFMIGRDKLKALLKQYNITKPEALRALRRRTTNLERYGGPAPCSSPEVVERMRTTKVERYGDPGYNNAAQIQSTVLERYGVTNISQAISAEQRSEMQTRARNTCLERYGAEYYMQSDQFQDHLPIMAEKQRATTLERYGAAYYSQSDTYRERLPELSEHRKATCRERYGVDNVSQTETFARARSGRYYYDGEYFDSSWELALWIYGRDHQESIIRSPCSLPYVFNGETHYYLPDFRYRDILIEIKGPQFFEDDKMICPFDRALDDWFEAKYQCMLQNGVQIWGKQEIMFALSYVREQYGRDYLQKYRS